MSSPRSSPWGVTDVLYLPLGSASEISSPESAGTPSRYAIAWAVAERVFPVQYLAADAVSVELRGAGISSRQVNNFGTPGKLQADRLIACEVAYELNPRFSHLRIGRGFIQRQREIVSNIDVPVSERVG